MEHSPKYEQIKKYYEEGLWSITAVRKAVERGWITKEEYRLITNEDYPE